MVKTTTCDQVNIGESATEPLSDSGGALGQLMVSLGDRRESIAKRSTMDCQYSDGYDHRGIISATTAANDVSACLFTLSHSPMSALERKLFRFDRRDVEPSTMPIHPREVFEPLAVVPH